MKDVLKSCFLDVSLIFIEAPPRPPHIFWWRPPQAPPRPTFRAPPGPPTKRLCRGGRRGGMGGPTPKKSETETLHSVRHACVRKE